MAPISRMVFFVAVALWATRHKCCFYFSAALRTAYSRPVGMTAGFVKSAAASTIRR